MKFNKKVDDIMNHKKILIVVTSHAQIDQNMETGLWLPEYAEPYEIFTNEGYDILTASINGGQAPIDPRSLNEDVQEKWPNALHELENTIPLNDLTDETFSGIFLPGGHGTMFDFPKSSKLQELIRSFAENNKVVAAVCHGPASLVGVTLSNGDPLVKHKKVTAFMNEEEKAANLDKVMPFLLEDKLKELGADFISAPLWSDHVEIDGKLITGQNPQSTISVAKAVVRALNND